MGNSAPQPTAVLVKRLQRVAKWIDRLADDSGTPAGLLAKPQLKARANTCWQAVARLALLADPDATICEGCSEKATTEDDAGVPLCDGCYEGLDRS